MSDHTAEYQNGNGGLVAGYARLIVNLRWLVILIMLGVVGFVGSGGRFIEFSGNYRYFFDEGNPYLQAFDKIEKTYSKLDSIIWAIQHDELDATEQEVAQIVYDLTERGWQAPYSIRVDSYTNFQYTQAFEDDLVVEDLVDDPSTIDRARAEELKKIIDQEPALAKRMLSEDDKTTIVMVTLKMDQDNNAAVMEIMNYAWAEADRIMAENPNVHVAVSGSVGIAHSFITSAQHDVTTLFPIVIVMLVLAMYLLTRSIPGTLATLLVVLPAAIMTMGTAGWLGIQLSPPSANAPTLVLTVAVADSIHILVTALIAMYRGRDKHDAIVESLRVNWGPVMLTSVTTAIGFASLNFAEAPPFRDLGTLSAIGALYAWILSITLFPALLAVLPLKARGSLEGQSRFMESFGRGVLAVRYPLLIILAGVIGWSAYAIQSIEFNDNYVEYFDERVRFRVDSDWMDENTTGVAQLNYSMEAGRYGNVSHPEYLRLIDDFAEWAREQPRVEHVAVFSDVMKRVNKSMHGDDWDYYRIPDSTEAGAQYLLLYEMSLPYGLDLNDQVNIDKTATRLIVTLGNLTTKQIGEFEAASNAWMEANMPEDMRANPAGQYLMFSYINFTNFEQMRTGTLIALLIISFCLMVSLRSFKLGLISLVPNVAPPLVAFGLFTLYSVEVGFWSSFIVVVALGLIVDATVHFLSKYKRAKVELGYSTRDSIVYAYGTVGTALFVATLALIAGFGVLAYSFWTINKMLGIMVSLTIAVAFIIDMLILPALLMLFDGDGKKESQKIATA